MRSRNIAALLFSLLAIGVILSLMAGKPQADGLISREAKSPGNLSGQMPPSFDQDVARVVAEIDRMRPTLLATWTAPRSIAKAKSAPSAS